MKVGDMTKLEKAMCGIIKKSKQGEWLNTSNEELMNKTPLQAISEGNIEGVLNLLNRIGFGIPT